MNPKDNSERFNHILQIFMKIMKEQGGMKVVQYDKFKVDGEIIHARLPQDLRLN